MIRLPKHSAILPWLSDPGTRALAASLRGDQIPKQLSVLLANCASTSDVKVLRAYCEYMALVDLEKQLGARPDDEEPD